MATVFSGGNVVWGSTGGQDGRGRRGWRRGWRRDGARLRVGLRCALLLLALTAAVVGGARAEAPVESPAENGTQNGGQNAIQSARLWTEPGQTRLVIDLAAPLDHKVFALADPDRVVVDLSDARLQGDLPVAEPTDPMVAGVRSGVRDGRDLRIVLDLKQPVRVKSFLLAPNETYGDRLVVDLSPKDGKPQVGPASPAQPGPDPNRAPAPTAGERDLIIAIDAGHGGEDPGAIGPAGTREKDMTLSIARKLAARVNQERGLTAVLIRDGDYFIGLRQRIAKARAARADLFVSIHADAFTDSSVRGSSVFTLSAGGATSEAARWLAERENRADLIGGIDLRERNEVLASVLLDMTQNATIEHSGIAAGKVLNKLQTLGAVHHQNIQQAGFAVLKSPDVPSMLVETAFLSNPDEEKRLRSGNYQNRLADAILAGIIDYFTEYPPPDTRFARAKDQRATATPTGNATRTGTREHRIASGDTLSAIADNYRVPLSALRDANGLRDDRLEVGQVLVIPEG